MSLEPRISNPAFRGTRSLCAISWLPCGRGAHQIKIVSRVNVRHFWRGRVPVRRLVTEAISIRKEMKRFSPDAWLVYGTSVTNPDLFGWWQRPKRYVLISTGAGTGKRLPPRWRRLFAFAHRRSLARADEVAAYHPRSTDQLRSFGVAEERLHLLLLAIKIWDWMPSRESARQRLELPQEVPVILCVGRFSSPEDDGKMGKTDMIFDLLAALARLPSDVVLVLVGDGPGRQRVEEKVATLKLERRVRLVGAVPHDDVRWFYAACDFFAFPYAVDRTWLVILEAQSVGRPVVTMHTRSAELTVDVGRTGLLAKDLQELQAHLAALASDRARCESMGQAGPEYIAKFHSIETRVRQIEEVLIGRT